jgi:hypothetical protein
MGQGFDLGELSHRRGENMTPLQAAIYTILLNPKAYKWDYQGFGFIRCYLHDNDEWRLHIWDNKKAIPQISDIHTHPWDFKSTIIFGTLYNYIYKEVKSTGDKFTKQLMQPGKNARLLSDKIEVNLLSKIIQYNVLDTYSQKKEIIHKTNAISGTVTLIRRFDRSRQDRTFVYYKTAEWIAGTPRIATESEIDHFTHMARMRAIRDK